jgi:hypothetical protein
MSRGGRSWPRCSLQSLFASGITTQQYRRHRQSRRLFTRGDFPPNQHPVSGNRENPSDPSPRLPFSTANGARPVPPIVKPKATTTG